MPFKKIKGFNVGGDNPPDEETQKRLEEGIKRALSNKYATGLNLPNDVAKDLLKSPEESLKALDEGLKALDDLRKQMEEFGKRLKELGKRLEERIGPLEKLDVNKGKFRTNPSEEYQNLINVNGHSWGSALKEELNKRTQIDRREEYKRSIVNPMSAPTYEQWLVQTSAMEAAAGIVVTPESYAKYNSYLANETESKKRIGGRPMSFLEYMGKKKQTSKPPLLFTATPKDR